jgi:hypothetical protein
MEREIIKIIFDDDEDLIKTSIDVEGLKNLSQILAELELVKIEVLRKYMKRGSSF